MTLPASVHIVEVGPRDGLQLLPTPVPTEVKVAMIEAVVRAGIREVEVGAFVSPTAMPQMADTGAVVRRVAGRLPCTCAALVPNVRGAALALEAGCDALRMVLAATDAANLRNVRRPVAQSLEECAAVARLAAQGGRRVDAVIGMSFGCPFTGPVAPAQVVALVQAVFDAGADGVIVADSIGVAGPLQVEALIGALRERWPRRRLGVHLHDTRGLAIANAFAALRAGASMFDGALGGLGAAVLGERSTHSGNVATEDLVNLCEELGVQTGADADALGAAARRVGEVLGLELPGRILASGTRRALFARIAAARESSP